MVEAGKDHLFTPPPSEAKKPPSFIKILQVEADIYHSIPRGPKSNWGKYLMGHFPAGTEFEIEGISWQQVTSKKKPKEYYEDNFLKVKIKSPSSSFKEEEAYTTLGGLSKLPPEKQKRHQEKQQPLTRRMRPRREKQPTVRQLETISQTKPPQVETKTGTEKTFELRLPVGTRLFTEHPRLRLEGETKDERKKYLDETANWVTKGRTVITVSGNREETWANEDHWMGGKVVVATREDLYPIDEDVKPLNLGQEIFVSKGEASPKRPKKKE